MADTIRTEADLLDNLFQDGQPANSISAQDMRDFVKTARYLQPLGWEFMFDHVHSSEKAWQLMCDEDGQRKNPEYEIHF